MLVGKPPFETDILNDAVKDLFVKILKNNYNIPFDLSYTTREVIRALLDKEAARRPSMTKLLEMNFYKEFTPECLPSSVLTTEPSFDNIQTKNRPLNKIVKTMNYIGNTMNVVQIIISSIGVTGTGHDELLPGPAGDENNNNKYIIDLQEQIQLVLNNVKIIYASQYIINLLLHHRSIKMLDIMKDSEEPNLAPVHWVAKWVDFSDRYGLGYQLCDRSNGVVFNDNSRIIHIADSGNLQYIEKNGTEYLHTLDKFPPNLSKKVTLLAYFQDYMNHRMKQNLMTTGENKRGTMIRLPYVKAWFRTSLGIVLYLSNGAFQIYFDDNTSLVVCPVKRAVTYINGTQDIRTFNLESLRKNGMAKDMYLRLGYIQCMIKRLLDLMNGKVEVLE